jgi:hypothetical protein
VIRSLRDLLRYWRSHNFSVFGVLTPLCGIAFALLLFALGWWAIPLLLADVALYAYLTRIDELAKWLAGFLRPKG